MNTKKIIMIVVFAVTLLTIATFIMISVIFFKEISSVSPGSKNIPAAASETPESTYQIPSKAVITSQTTEETMVKRKALPEIEALAARARTARRAEAFARQKELEASLLKPVVQDAKKPTTPPPPKKEIEPSSAEDLKAMEDKGIISY